MIQPTSRHENNIVRRNLALQNLDWVEVLKRLAHFATSEMVRQKIRNLPDHESPATAEIMLGEIAEWSHIFVSGSRPRAESLDLFSPWHQRLNRNAVLKTLELKDVRHFCIEIINLKEALEETTEAAAAHTFAHLREVEGAIFEATEPLAAIDQIMTAAGDIRTDASEKLYQLHGEKNQLARQVQSILDRLVKSYHIEHLLQDRYVTTREGRWVLPIKSGMQHGFEGIIHDASHTKQTVFMEPQEAVPLNNRLREIEVEIDLEIERLLTELSQYLSERCDDFDHARTLLLKADERLAEGELATKLKAVAPKIDGTHINLKNVRHPLLVLNEMAVVPNSIELQPDRRLLLLSGPNAGGKTVLLKSIGLAAQMVRCGLPICADDGSKIPFFSQLVVALGDSQSVDANLSTFAAHLKTLERAADATGADSLILIDEICGSTDPEEGAALARSFLDAYCDNGVFGVVTSHLGALKSGWKEGSGLVNGSLEFDPKSGPTYRFIMGIPGQSLAIQTAQRVGVQKVIVERALHYLSPERRKYEETLSEVERMKKDILRIQDSLNTEIKASTEAKEKYESMLAKIETEKDQKIEREVRAAQKQVEELIQEAKAQEVFRRHDSLQKIKFDLPKLIKASGATGGSTATGQTGVARSTSANIEIQSPEDFALHFKPGTAVHVESLGRDGIVQGVPNARGVVPILSNSMRLMISWRDLKPTSQQGVALTARLKKIATTKFTSAETDRVVDVRGLTAEEAISQLEIQLDTASMGDEDRIKVVHGHGTDTLKRAVRSYLSRSVYVKKWQAGNADTGGDGITWVELKG